MEIDPSDSWQIVFYIVEKDHLPVFEAILEPFVDGISMDEDAGDDGRRVVGYCSVQPDSSELESRLLVGALAAGVTAPKINIESVASVDWVAQYQARTPPVTIGRFFIFPDHYTGELPTDRMPIALNAGLAFGTGEHQTTEGCLRILEGLVAGGHQVRNAIDVGCGSAILAIGVSKLWPDTEILACDNDPSAIRTASENVRKNFCTSMVNVFESDFYSAPEINATSPFDLVIANILAGPLIGAAADTAKQVSLTGRVILSGILNDQAGDVIAAHEAAGLTVLDRLEIDEWTTLVLKIR
ncbi:MAG: methyltransferase [Alphaproteobacteria bacterium]|nr:methyltransferase [Alphaproteobacteria bacterium]